MIDKILVWNYKGTGNQYFLVNAKMLVNNVKPNFLALMETTSLFDKVKGVFLSLVFSNFTVIN